MANKRHYEDKPPTRHRATPPKLKRPAGWSRKCRRCGRDPWPNYFFCPDCFALRLYVEHYEPEIHELPFP